MKRKADTQLFELARKARAFLEPHWMKWHDLAGEPPPAILSAGVCGRSSLFLQRALCSEGFDAMWRSGAPSTAKPGAGFLGSDGWIGHAWVECDGSILDITADQFGLAPVLITPSGDPRYQAGDDVAFADAVTRRKTAVAAIWPHWLNARTGATHYP